MTDWQVYTADCLTMLDDLRGRGVAAVISDPPYGIKLKTDYGSRGRSAKVQSNDYPPIEGDDRPFDPSPWLDFPVVVLFGGNYYADRLPPSSGWVVWDKLNGLQSKRPWGFNDGADVELIWTNVPQVARLIPHRWMGAIKESERRERRVHPTQKPVALMQALVERYTSPGDLVLDPYCGSGSTGVACMLTGRRFIGIEKVPRYAMLSRVRIAAALVEYQRGGKWATNPLFTSD